MERNDRDRLIELIGQKPFTSEYENYNSLEWTERFADYLLANGVIVPPCKVGTLVWCVWRTHELNIEQRYYVNQSSVIGFTSDQGVTKPLTGDYACHGAFLGNHLVEVCYSPEEAERKLKERDVNC